MSNYNDEIRDKLLRYLFKKHKIARGPKGVAIGIREIQQNLKQYGIKSCDVNSNLDYLIQKGWIKPVVENRTFTTPRGTIQQAEKISYKISDIGIDRLEGASTYNRQESFSKINITNIHGVTVVGNGNVVNTEYTELSKALSELENAVKEYISLNEENKLNIISDIGTIQTQLSKPNPNFNIIKTIWNGMKEILPTAATIVELIGKISSFISK